MQKNERQIPNEFTSMSRPKQSSMFEFTENMTIVSYKPKRNKLVIILSTMHHDDSIDEITGE